MMSGRTRGPVHDPSLFLEFPVGTHSGGCEFHIDAGRFEHQRVDLLHGLQPVDGLIDQFSCLKMNTVSGFLADALP